MSKHILFSIKTSKREVWGCLFLSKFAFLDQQQKHLSLHTPTKTLFGPHVHLGEDPSKRMLHSGQLFWATLLVNVVWAMCSGQCVLVNSSGQYPLPNQHILVISDLQVGERRVDCGSPIAQLLVRLFKLRSDSNQNIQEVAERCEIMGSGGPSSR